MTPWMPFAVPLSVTVPEMVAPVESPKSMSLRVAAAPRTMGVPSAGALQNAGHGTLL